MAMCMAPGAPVCMCAGQGVYLNEHRNMGGARSLLITLQGAKRADGRKYGSVY